MLKRIAPSPVLCALLFLAGCHEHGHHHGHDHGDVKNRPAELKLTPRFSSLLRREMILIEGGMTRLQAALIRGNGSGAAREAERIEASFILKQSLSADEMKKLGALLPAEFIKLDADFHKRAGKLARFARGKDFAGASREYARMSESCVTCHARFARERFPGLGR